MEFALDSLYTVYSDISQEQAIASMLFAPESMEFRKRLIEFYLRDSMCREVCDFYPNKATCGIWRIGDDTKRDGAQVDIELTNRLRSLEPQKAFRLAQNVANIIGTSILMIDDGSSELAAPAEGAIALHLMLPEQFGNLIVESDAYQMAEGSVVHKSRVLAFYGIENPFDTRGYGASRLHAFLKEYEPYKKASTRLGLELSDRSIFTVKKKGLEKETKTTDGRTILKKLFTTLRKGLDTLGMLSIDLDTMEAEWKERSFAGVDVPLAELRRNVIAASDIPEMELFGTQDKAGLQEKGLADRAIAAIKATELQAEWGSNLEKLKTAIAGSKSNLKILLGDPLQLNPLEIAEMNLKNAQSELAMAEARKANAEANQIARTVD